MALCESQPIPDCCCSSVPANILLVLRCELKPLFIALGMRSATEHTNKASKEHKLSKRCILMAKRLLKYMRLPTLRPIQCAAKQKAIYGRG